MVEENSTSRILASLGYWRVGQMREDSGTRPVLHIEVD